MVIQLQEKLAGPGLAPDVHVTSLWIFLFKCPRFRCLCSNFSLSCYLFH